MNSSSIRRASGSRNQEVLTWIRSVHHVFPYEATHIAPSVSAWWKEQQQIWPVAAALRGQLSDRTYVHVIGPLAADPDDSRLRVHPARFSGPRNGPFGWDWSRSLGRALHQLGPQDVCIIHGAEMPSARLAGLAAMESNIVTVYHHGHVGPADVLKKISTLLVGLRSEVIDALKAAGIPPERLIETTPSVADEFFEVERAVTSADYAQVGFVGKLTTGKGAPELLATLRYFRSRGRELAVEIVGSSFDSQRDFDVVVQAENFKVSYLGHIENPRVASAMARWNALLLPSRAEGCPRVALEALAAGVPVVGLSGVIPEKIMDGVAVVTTSREEFPVGVEHVLLNVPRKGTFEVPNHSEQGTFFDQIAERAIRIPRRSASARPGLGLWIRVERLAKVRPLGRALRWIARVTGVRYLVRHLRRDSN